MSLDLLDKCACFRSWGGHLVSFLFGYYLAPILRMYGLEIQNYCAILRTSISLFHPSVHFSFVVQPAAGAGVHHYVTPPCLWSCIFHHISIEDDVKQIYGDIEIFKVDTDTDTDTLLVLADNQMRHIVTSRCKPHVVLRIPELTWFRAIHNKTQDTYRKCHVDSHEHREEVASHKKVLCTRF